METPIYVYHAEIIFNHLKLFCKSHFS